MIRVTRTVLPPLEEYVGYLEQLWESAWVTNNGVLLRTLEQRLAETLGVDHVVVVANGTLAIQLVLRALKLHAEVITTPFSYVATASSLVWEGCHPAFADVEPDTLTLDPERAEQMITPATTGILATHVYGIPCDVEALAKVAERKGLRLVYDAAHAFGVRYRGRSLLTWGDASTLSFHATKLFHTVEGGAVVTANPELADAVRRLRNFGQTSPDVFVEPGINAKTSEFHAAMGLCLLPRLPALIAGRREIAELYDRGLAPLGDMVTRPRLRPGTEWNYAYYPLLLRDERSVLRVQERLRREAVETRRYFYPSLSDLPYVSAVPTPISRSAAARVLCLPLWPGLELPRAATIADLIVEELSSS
jgi:dTDP-4-amino-4,6-dideoxygalactose transaminase